MQVIPLNHRNWSKLTASQPFLQHNRVEALARIVSCAAVLSDRASSFYSERTNPLMMVCTSSR
jgi:hypothetical protein